VLTGQLGNGGISWSGGQNRIFYLFARGHWDAGLRALAAWRAWQNRSWPGTVKSQLLRPVLGPFWQQRHRLLRPGAPSWADLGAIQPAFARRMNLHAVAQKSHIHKLFMRPIDPRQERSVFFSLNAPSPVPSIRRMERRADWKSEIPRPMCGCSNIVSASRTSSTRAMGENACSCAGPWTVCCPGSAVEHDPRAPGR